MASEWPSLLLRDAGVELIDCEHRTPPAAQRGYPYVTIPQLRAGRVDLSDARRIAPGHFADWTRKARPAAYDVVLSRRCNPGETAFVEPGQEFALGQNLVLLRADGTRVHPPFLRWLVRGSEWWDQVAKFINVGAVFDSLRCADVPGFMLPIPPLQAQRAIAHILGALDDKIELNRRMSETLEAMARALFKSWFVDFDPVRAKMAGDDQWQNRILDVFPESIGREDEIPAGWRMQRLGDIVETRLGGTPSRAESTYWGGDIPWINSGKANDFRVVEPSEFITPAGLASSATTLLPRRTVVIAITGATLGQVSLLEIETCANQSVVGVLGSDRLPGEFLFYWVKENIAQLVAQQTGGAQQHINKNNVNDLPVLCPSEGAISLYVEHARPMFDRIRQCCFESLTLARLRDAFLPKLISGELRIKDAERFLSRAGVSA
ncbi:MAG: restriction endonuclease subunit S [Gemmatimonadales bacterium]|nr:restriction endonuclease subunit S [Gemmatimonadales bacterium]